MNEDDSDLHAHWQRHSRETPSPALDDAIRAAAHRAVRAKPAALSARARAPWPAWATFAAAASIGAIAIGVWQLQPRDVDDTQMVASDIPARPSASATDAKSASQARAEGRIAGAPASAETQSPAQAIASAPRGKPVDRETETPVTNAQDKVAPTFAAAPSPTPRPAPEAVAGNGAPAERDQRAGPAAARGAMVDRKKEPTVTHAPATRADVAQAPAAPSPFPAGGVTAESQREEVPALQKTQSAAAKPAAPALSANAASDAATAPPSAAPARSTESSSAMKRSDANAELAAAGAPTSSTALDKSSPTAKDRSIDDAIGRIRRALAEHRDADAAAELTALRARFDDADARLPADLRAWAAQVPRAQR